MNCTFDESRLDDLLRRVLGLDQPRPDFGRWRAEHPEAVRMLQSGFPWARPIGAAGLLGTAIGAWIMRHKAASASAAVAAVALAVLAVVAWRVNGGAGAQGRPAAPGGAGGGTDQVAQAPPAPGRTASAFYFPPTAIRVSWAEAVVRATMQDLPGDHMVCNLTRAIYGRVPGDVLHVDVRGFTDIARHEAGAGLGRDPNQAEIKAALWKRMNFQPGRDVILYLDQCHKSGDVVACRHGGATYDVPPKHLLDDHEKEIVEVVRSGAHLTSADKYPDRYIPRCDLVVRGRLERVGQASAEWKVMGVLYIAPPGGPRQPGQPAAIAPGPQTAPAPEAITIGLEPWRLRAECIIRYRPEKGPAKAPPGKEVAEEFARLVKAELTVGQEAILFLKGPPAAEAEAPHGLIGILRGDPAKPGDLDRIEKRLRGTIGTGEYRIQKL